MSNIHVIVKKILKFVQSLKWTLDYLIIDKLLLTGTGFYATTICQIMQQKLQNYAAKYAIKSQNMHRKMH